MFAFVVNMRIVDTLINRLKRKKRCKFKLCHRPTFFSNSYDIMMECWKTEPLQRPDFEGLRSLLHSMIQDEEQVRNEMFV